MHDESDKGAFPALEPQSPQSDADRLKLEAIALERRLRVSEELAAKALLSASREDQLVKQLKTAEAEAAEAVRQQERLVGERDVLQKTCDRLSQEAAHRQDGNPQNGLQIRLLGQERDRLRQQLDEACVELKTRDERSEQLRAMLERERHEKLALMKQRDDMLLQLHDSTVMIEKLRSQLAEAAVSLAKNEDERKARLRAQPRVIAALPAHREADVEKQRQVLFERLKSAQRPERAQQSSFFILHQVDAKAIQDFCRAHQEFADDMAQNLLNLKKIERELHKNLGSFASDIGPRALQLPPFPAGAFGFRVLPEIKMCKTASSNLSAHLDTASQAVEAMAHTRAHAKSESQPEDIPHGRPGRVENESSNAAMLDASPDVSHYTLQSEEFDTPASFIDAAPPPPMPSPTQGRYSPNSLEEGDKVELQREKQESELHHSHGELEESLRGTGVSEQQDADEQQPAVVDAQYAIAADLADGHDLQALERNQPLLAPDRVPALRPDKHADESVKEPTATAPAPVDQCRFSKWAPTHDEHIDKMVKQGVELDFAGDPLFASGQGVQRTVRSVGDILSERPTKSCLSPVAACSKPQSQGKSSKQLRFADKGNVLCLLEPKAAELRGCGPSALLGSVSMLSSSWHAHEITEDDDVLDDDVHRREAEQVRENTEINAGSMFSFC